ncbi:glycoside hydrolase family 108 protein [Vibrio sp. LaRot3]|uniref:glycoside hydrolase family 108 protein n=1 Tax=Vibrio sp. LaRot3 TaxID=2998829 RepID=UPI0022CE04B8|nr:N-acetylmuramidase [Vibrio sp. LaRot3]MDA0148837.1 N-acetylmuramidase [Vibrio sp. LaRot3]
MKNFAFSTKGYSESFCHAVEFILIAEGALYPNGKARPGLGYVNDPKDAGGETKGGISKRAFPSVDIQALTLDKIVRLYHRNYWRVAYCQDWQPATAVLMFDAAVQHGANQAIRMLQEIAGTKADGKVGPKTRAAVQSFDQAYLVARYGLRRGRFYARIIKKNHTQCRFIEGWHNRLVELTNHAWELI